MPEKIYMDGFTGGDGVDRYCRDLDARTDIADIKSYIGYDDNTVAGLDADFENRVFSRLAGAVGKSGGTDFNVFLTYAGMRRCNLSDAGVVTAYYGDVGYAEDGSNGQVMVEVPKFYYKVVPIKLQAQSWDDYEASDWVSGTSYAVGKVVIYDEAYYACITANSDEEFTPEKWHEIDTLGLIGYHNLHSKYYISSEMRDGFKVHPAFVIKGAVAPQATTRDYVYISAFEGILYDVSASAYLLNDDQVADVTATTGDKLSSIAGVYERSYTYNDKTTGEDVTITVNAGPKPASGKTAGNNLTRHNFTVVAQNRGSGWGQQTIEIASMLQLLYAIEYATFNWQNNGAGVTSIADNSVENCASFIGSTSSLGNTSGNVAATTDYTGTSRTTSGTLATSYRGIENFFGNIWKWVEGLNLYGAYNNGGGQLFICTDNNFADNKSTDNYESAGFTAANVSTYVRYFGYGSEKYDWLFVTSKTGHGANASLPVGDYTSVTASLNGYRAATLGGSWNSATGAGGFCWYLYTTGGRSRNCGGRLAYGI